MKHIVCEFLYIFTYFHFQKQVSVFKWKFFQIFSCSGQRSFLPSMLSYKDYFRPVLWLFHGEYAILSGARRVNIQLLNYNFPELSEESVLKNPGSSVLQEGLNYR